MFSLNFDFLDEPIKLEGFTELVIENRTVFTKVVQALYEYSDDEEYIQIFNEDYQALKANELMLVNDVLGFDINSATTLKLVYQDIIGQINDKPEVKSKIESYLNQAMQIIKDELVEFEIDLVSDEILLTEALKSLGVKIEIVSDTIFERFFEIIQVFKYLKAKELLVVINAGVYFSKSEIAAISEYTELQNMNMLMINSAKYEGVKSRYVLDEDFVIMHEHMV
ncbi:type II-A CRISPR-associated protein Csn2 [Weissella cibaria]|uniref:type II-A CRISPR-associated protein Csn2 n=1 Tax=Weissella cibaria TaxID=137591 RepID=UPI001431896B|nr:type II-A CRISPR-associated protein Csn2 [Weissella cibaria]MBZ5941432.1 type II-A CRISPR-associated protein Csn2 [Weissella cibaria]MCB5825334.1 type II-A CRISPR-associated protein Csn2 [Weissella cibaria]MCB5856893.1 type II-A CRISPR-associated protein Csn2 [Weissella cibaria]MCB5859152.1 type II-A CRISPR-associated protein Csn2 [Weissella cibaria]MCB5861411.1 type II-A CRISPR-associated protein Csn2 [Weissella cibaria]